MPGKLLLWNYLFVGVCMGLSAGIHEVMPCLYSMLVYEARRIFGWVWVMVNVAEMTVQCCTVGTVVAPGVLKPATKVQVAHWIVHKEPYEDSGLRLAATYHIRKPERHYISQMHGSRNAGGCAQIGSSSFM